MIDHFIRYAAKSILTLVALAACTAETEVEPLMVFAERTRQAIVVRDVSFFQNSFSNAWSFTFEHGPDAIGFSDPLEAWLYEGAANRQSVNEIVSSANLQIHILEDWIPSDEPGEAIHLIIYYSGDFEDIDWVADYMQRYCVTEVRQRDGQWRFAYSLFKSESGHPFIGDYG